MADKDKQLEWNRNYRSKFQYLQCRVTPEFAEEVKAYCEIQGKSVSALILDLLQKELYGEGDDNGV